MYSVTNLTTIADCDVLLTMANKEQGDLTFKKLSEERLAAWRCGGLSKPKLSVDD